LKIVTEHITILNEELILTNQRAIYWNKESALILSDLHIGKTAHFRRHGIPMPDDILQKDLRRLKELINHFNTRRLIIVGDLFHAEANSDMDTFKTWLKQFDDLSLVLVKGNHDRQSQRLMDELNIHVESTLIIDPFIFIHDPSDKTTKNFTFSGHIHPGVLLKGKGKQKLKLPCYQVSENQIILPAFSLFTGLNTLSNKTDVVSYAFTDTAIFRLQ
jgi:DNA ligase-associated metallophosphoesterase